MQQFTEYVIKNVVDYPDQVAVTAMEGAKTVVLEVRCNTTDVGKLIGKRGKTIGAIRALLNSVAAKEGRRAMLEVVE